MKLTPSQKKRAVRVFRDAAEALLLGRRSFSCTAIQYVTRDDCLIEMEVHRALFFKGSYAEKMKWDAPSIFPWWKENGIDGDEIRVIALLLAAELVRTDCLP